MIRHILLLLLMGTTFLGYAQHTQYYSANPEEFAGDIVNDIKRAGCEYCKETADEFEALVEGGSFDSLQLLNIRNNAETMRHRQMSTSPNIASYIRSIITVKQVSGASAHYIEWNNLFSQMVNGQTFTNTAIVRFLDFTNLYYGEKTLFKSAGRSWTVSEITPQIKNSNGKLSIDFQNVTLKGATEGDTLNILEASGTLYPLESRWEGVNGKITWANAGFDPKKVFATFEKHSINLADNEFTIEPATLHYAEKFNKPVKGKLTYRLLIGKTEQASEYPRFETHDNTLVVKNIMEGVQYIGGFTIKGQEIQGAGTTEQPARLLFFDRNDHQVAEARSLRFLISANEALSSSAEFFLFFQKDTIYHPGVELRYIAGERQLIASQGKAGIGQAPFINTFQNIEMDVKRIFWDFDNDKIYMVNKNPMSVNNPPAYFKSEEFFNRTEFLQYQGQLGYNPISSVSQAMRSIGTNVIDARNIVRFFNPNLSVAQIEPLLFKMVADGFIYYDPKNKVVTVRDKARKYVLANSKKVDFDFISLKSETDSANAVLNLTTRNLNINGVYGVTLSSKHFVHAFPVDKQIRMSENRDMSWDGTLFAGNIDYFGQNFKFDYNRFAIEMVDVDSMVINVPTGEVDEYGDPVMKPLKSALNGLTGTLFIDAPFNKSGYLDIPGYPKFDNSSTAYTYYDKKKKFKDVYVPDSFHFAIDTFSMDSLTSFDFSSQNFTGRLNSAGIFPEIHEELTIMADGSLGFRTTTPDSGYQMYQGLGEYNGGLTLSNSGLEGNGEISFLTATVTAQDFLFMPKSTTGDTAILNMARGTRNGVEFPSVYGDTLDVNWMPYQDSMILKNTKQKFQLFDNYAEHKGTLVLTTNGLKGSGTTTFGNALINSDAINYGGFSVKSDTALFRIKSDDEDRDLFTLENASLDINFDSGEGTIQSNRDTITHLPFNLYNTTVNRFRWDISDSLIYFEPDEEKEFAVFRSLHKDQDSLWFNAKGGSYDLNTLEMKATGVPHIAVADVYVVPKNGEVKIGESAKMKTLEGATVLMDSLDQNFRLYDASINILGKKDLRGEGKYDYVNRSGKPQAIDFPIISTYHRSNMDTLYTHAEGIVYDTMDFFLDPQIKFRGDVHMHSRQNLLRFDGVSHLLLPNNANVRSGWFRINDYVEPNDVSVSAYNPVNYDGDSLYTGIHLRYDSTNLYSTLVGRKVNYLDYTVMDIAGKVKYDASTDAYIVADSALLSGAQTFGDLYRYENKTGNIHTEGHSDLGLDFDMISVDAYGTIDKVPSDTFYRFDEMLALDFYLSEEFTKELHSDMVSQTYQSDHVDFFDEKFRRYFGQLVGDQQQLDDIYLELNKTGILTLPKKFPAPRLLLTGVEFHWDEEVFSYLGKGTCGVAMVNGENVGKTMEYYVEFGFRKGNDYFNLFLKAPTDEWYYFSYENRTLNVLTSNFVLNKLVTNTKMKDRKFKNDKGTMLFTISSEYRQQKFLQKMKYYVGQLD